MPFAMFTSEELCYAWETQKPGGPKVLEVFPRVDTEAARAAARDLAARELPVLAEYAGPHGVQVRVHDKPAAE